jgi:hypothetical protein
MEYVATLQKMFDAYIVFQREKEFVSTWYDSPIKYTNRMHDTQYNPHTRIVLLSVFVQNDCEKMDTFRQVWIFLCCKDNKTLLPYL